MCPVATVRPFSGITFDPTRIPDLGQVTCPPYDVIGDAERDALYERNPYNVVRIVSGRDQAGDTPDENRYTRACGFFRSWLWEGVLHEDHRPALYVYRQAFSDPRGHLRRVWGTLATIGLDDEVLSHERTMSGPKEDRLALMQALPANVSPIYALYREDGGHVSASLAEHSSDAPVADFVDDDGTRHTAWAVHDPAFHEKVAAGLVECPLFIADGHHRFETAKLYRQLRHGPGAWDHTMALLVDVGAQPALILPYHRIVRSALPEDARTVLEQHFEVTDAGPPDADRAKKLADELWDASPSTFVAVLPGALYRLEARESSDDIPAATLARLALEPLGVSDAERDLSFTPDAAEVATAVTSGRAAGGFLIPPVDVERVWELARDHGKMPAKSTYFFPKPRDGIVIRALDPC
jgi:uncharacterized protein (DUF1015 family)